MRKLGVLALAAFCVLPLAVCAQGTNDGAEVVATFVAVPPTIDGVVSQGEWDAAGATTGTWSAHDSATVAVTKTVVKFCYSVDALYILWDCDGTPKSPASGFDFSGGSDTNSLYIQPMHNAPDGGYTYGIQIHPSKSAQNVVNAQGNSLTYAELGSWWASKRFLYDPPKQNADGTITYVGAGASYPEALKNTKMLDGPRAGGYVSEWKIPWSDFVPLADHSYGDIVQIEGPLYEAYINGSGAEAVQNQWLGIRTHELDANGNYVANRYFGGGNGMPKPGTQWWMQLGRYVGGVEVVNWVGDTGGFASPPFGTLTFGSATGSDVANALLHMQ